MFYYEDYTEWLSIPIDPYADDHIKMLYYFGRGRVGKILGVCIESVKFVNRMMFSRSGFIGRVAKRKLKDRL